MAAKITKTVTIKLPKAQVFATLSDFRKMAQFGSGVSKVKQVSGPNVGIGAKYHTEGKILGRNVIGKMEVIAYDPPNAITIKGVFANVPYEDRMTLKSVESATQLTLSDTSSPSGFFKTFNFIYRAMLTWYINHDLKNLKKHLETKLS